MYLDVDGTVSSLPFRSLSGGEQELVFIGAKNSVVIRSYYGKLACLSCLGLLLKESEILFLWISTSSTVAVTFW